MLIILEGQDCSSKSTLAQNLVDVIKTFHPDDRVDLLHKGPPTQHALDEYAAPLLDYRPNTGRHIVCDRWHLGELVYPRVLGRPTTIDPAVSTWLEMFLRSRGALLVYCHADDEYLANCAQSRGDDESFIRTINQTSLEFDAVVEATLLSRIAVDASLAAEDPTLANHLHVDAKRVEEWSARLNEFVTYVGPHRPTRLLVGDRRGIQGVPSDNGRWPAFVPYGATSGHYLFSALADQPLTVAQHGVTLTSVGVANANDVDDVHALWSTLNEPEVVALGRQAESTLIGYNIPHVLAQHPQYRRRFHYTDRSAYLAQLTAKVEVVL